MEPEPLFAELDDKVRNVLDLGGGSNAGDWARGFAKRHPRMFVAGIDLFTPENFPTPENFFARHIQLPVPRNCRFLNASAAGPPFADFVPGFPNFDYVHAYMAGTKVPDYQLLDVRI